MENVHDIFRIIRTRGALKNFLLRRPNTCFRSGRDLLNQSSMPRITERQLDTIIGKRRILIYGYPKSGNVCLTSMLNTLFDLQEKQISFTHNYPTSRAQEIVILYRSEIIRSVLLIRDPRDILYSLYRMSATKNWWDERTRGIFNSIDKFFFDYYLPVYIKSRNPFEMWDSVARYVPVIRYEYLHSNCHDELRQLCNQWNIEVSELKIANAVKENTLENIRTKDFSHLHNLDITIHARSGIVGEGKDKLTQEVIDVFEKEFGSDLNRWGYP